MCSVALAEFTSGRWRRRTQEKRVMESETDHVGREAAGWEEQKVGGNCDVGFMTLEEKKWNHKNICFQTDVNYAKSNWTLRPNERSVRKLIETAILQIIVGLLFSHLVYWTKLTSVLCCFWNTWRITLGHFYHDYSYNFQRYTQRLPSVNVGFSLHCKVKLLWTYLGNWNSTSHHFWHWDPNKQKNKNCAACFFEKPNLSYLQGNLLRTPFREI